jgi:hypothetical protein
MKWELLRKEYRQDGIFGELTSPGGQFFFTLEHAYPGMYESGAVHYNPKIPEGIHRIVEYQSPKFGMIVPLLDNLEDPHDQDRKFEIHIGNYNEDSEGCILIGLGLGTRHGGGKMLTSSKQAFKLLMSLGITELQVKNANRSAV